MHYGSGIVDRIASR